MTYCCKKFERNVNVKTIGIAKKIEGGGDSKYFIKMVENVATQQPVYVSKIDYCCWCGNDVDPDMEYIKEDSELDRS